MKSNHSKEHVDKSQYGDRHQTIESVKLPVSENFKIFSELNQIVLVSEGSLTISGNGLSDKKVKNGESVLLPMQTPCVVTALEDATFLVMKFANDVNLHDYFPPNSLSEEHQEPNAKRRSVGFLKPHPQMMAFANTIKSYKDDGVKSVRLYEVKIEEFLFLIKEYCDKKQIANFFAPIYSSDFIFSHKVLEYLNKAKTVKDMAQLFDYSLSGYEKKFKRIFNVSPYKWMREQRSKKIYHEVCYGPKTFTLIASEYGFSSPAHFNDFCKTFYDSTPGQLRKKMRLS